MYFRSVLSKGVVASLHRPGGSSGHRAGPKLIEECPSPGVPGNTRTAAARCFQEPSRSLHLHPKSPAAGLRCPHTVNAVQACHCQAAAAWPPARCQTLRSTPELATLQPSLRPQRPVAWLPLRCRRAQHAPPLVLLRIAQAGALHRAERHSVMYCLHRPRAPGALAAIWAHAPEGSRQRGAADGLELRHLCCRGLPRCGGDDILEHLCHLCVVLQANAACCVLPQRRGIEHSPAGKGIC